MKDLWTQNSLKRKNHKPSQSNKPTLSDNSKESTKEELPKIDRVDTILDTVETENIAGMLRFLLHEEEIDKELSEENNK